MQPQGGGWGWGRFGNTNLHLRGATESTRHYIYRKCRNRRGIWTPAFRPGDLLALGFPLIFLQKSQTRPFSRRGGETSGNRLGPARENWKTWLEPAPAQPRAYAGAVGRCGRWAGKAQGIEKKHEDRMGPARESWKTLLETAPAQPRA